MRDYAVERYNRRTRALERQAAALEAIGDALRDQAAAARVTALAAAAATQSPTVDGAPRSWTDAFASGLMRTLSRKAADL